MNCEHATLIVSDDRASASCENCGASSPLTWLRGMDDEYFQIRASAWPQKRPLWFDEPPRIFVLPQGLA